MKEIYLIGRIVRKEESKLQLEIFISPVHKTSEIVNLILTESLTQYADIREGDIVAVKASPLRRAFLYDIRNLQVRDIVPLSQIIENAQIRATLIEETNKLLYIKQGPPLK